MRTLVKQCVVTCLVVMFASSTLLFAQDNSGKTIVLDTSGFWRLYHTLRPPVIESDGGPKPFIFGKKWLDQETGPPPAGWEKPDFDDSAWLRGPARIAFDSPYVAQLCLRGRFTVTDPAKVKELVLTVGYHGGAIVYVNGKRIKQAHLPEKVEDGSKALAEGYPEEAFVNEKGGMLAGGKKASAEAKQRLTLRTRKLSDVAIPSEFLRSGVNVVAIEIIRAPYGKVMEKFRDKFNHPGIQRLLKQKKLASFIVFDWNTCDIRYVQLAASGNQGLVQNAVRPAGLQVWNSNLMASDFGLDFGDPAGKPHPITIVGTRNGSFSGKVVAGSNKAIKGLKAAMSDLKGAGTIPASAVRIRYGIPWGSDAEATRRYPTPPILLGALAESPLPEIPVRKTTASAYWLKHGRYLVTPNQPSPVFGAVASVWVTVDVPADVKPGDYTGELTIEAEGEKAVEVPVKLTVVDWKLPDPDNYSTWIELTQSPDTLVEEYKFKPWSDKHFEMIAVSMKHLNRIGSRVLYIPVICHTNIGNEESMVRWIKKGEYEYDWDFSIMDRYLDTAEKYMGKPKVVCFWVWEKYMFPTVEDPKTFEGSGRYKEGKPTRTYRTDDSPRGSNEAIKTYVGKGPKVTVLDPATGKIENQHLPYLLDPKSKTIWKPLFDRLQEYMKKRGLQDVMMIGTTSDIVLRPPHFAFFREVAADLPWVSHSHMNHTSIFKAGNTKLGYYSTVFNVVFALDPEEGRRHGWQKPDLHAHLLRSWHQATDVFPPTTFRHMAELNIAGNQRGIGHLGADFWYAVKDKSGRRRGRVYQKHPEALWRSNDICTSFLAPGPDGPIATVRYEMLREGVQECEARIFIERALTDEKLRTKIGNELAKRCQEALDERTRSMIRGVSTLKLTGYWRTIAPLATHGAGGWWNKPGISGHAWFISSGWQERTKKLFSLAGEVVRELGSE